MKYLGIDWGKKRIGLAIGTLYPKGAGVLDGSKPQGEIIEKIAQLVEREEIDLIVLGLPQLPSGDEGEMATEIRKFGSMISEKTGRSVEYEPEEFTSKEATEELRERNVQYTRESGKVDELSAILILEQYIREHE